MRKSLIMIAVAVLSTCVTLHAQDSSGVFKLGQVTDLWYRPSPPKIVDDLVYIGVEDHIRIVDISDPTNPGIIGTFAPPDTIVFYILSLDVSGDRLYVGFRSSEIEIGGFFIFDISDPIHPEFVQDIRIQDFVPFSTNVIDGIVYLSGVDDWCDHELRLNAEIHVYETDEGGFLQEIDIIPIAGGDSVILSIAFTENYIITVTEQFNGINLDAVWLTEINGEEESIPWQNYYPNNIQPFGNYALSVTDSEIQILDISNIPDYEIIERVERENLRNYNEVIISDDLAYIINGSGIQTVDISNPENPEIVTEYPVIIGDTKSDIAGNIGCVVGLYYGPVFFDFSDLDSIHKVSEFEYDFAELGNIYYTQDYLFVVDYIRGIRIFDVSDPSRMEQIDLLELYCWRGSEMRKVGDFLYIHPTHQDGLKIVDISRIDSVYLAAEFEIEGQEIESMVIRDNNAFIDTDSSFVILDISDPIQPEIISSYNCLGKGLALSRDYAYLSYNMNFESYFIKILDISEFYDVYEANRIEVSGYGTCIVYDDVLAMIPNYFSREIQLFDISDQLHPERTSTWNCERVIESVQIDGDYIYVGVMSDGLILLNISDPYNPYEVGFYNTNTSITGMSLAGNIVYCADSKSLYSFDCSQALSVPHSTGIAQPASPVLNGCYPNPFNSTTTITYTLPMESNVALQVYNTRGQLVDVLQDRVMTAGEHSIVWEGAGIPSGVYFCRLEAGQQLRYGKLVLLR